MDVVVAHAMVQYKYCVQYTVHRAQFSNMKKVPDIKMLYQIFWLILVDQYEANIEFLFSNGRYYLFPEELEVISRIYSTTNCTLCKLYIEVKFLGAQAHL